jgi:hypothetical protein
VRIPVINVVDYNTNELMAVVHLNSPIILDSITDLTIRQTLKVDLYENIKVVGSILNNIISKRKLNLPNFKVTFPISINVMGIFEYTNIMCEQVIKISDLVGIKTRKMEMVAIQKSQYSMLSNILVHYTVFPEPKAKQQDYLSFESPDWLWGLLPNPKLNIFLNPKLLGFEAGLDISFDKPPGLNFDIAKVTFDCKINGHTTASIDVARYEMSQFSKDSKLQFIVKPKILTHPISGPISAASSIIKGTTKSVFHGLYGGAWGKGGLVIDFKNIRVINENKREIQWLNRLLNSLQLEYDLRDVLYTKEERSAYPKA